jgi:hypothetical protein
LDPLRDDGFADQVAVGLIETVATNGDPAAREIRFGEDEFETPPIVPGCAGFGVGNRHAAGVGGWQVVFDPYTFKRAAALIGLRKAFNVGEAARFRITCGIGQDGLSGDSRS